MHPDEAAIRELVRRWLDASAAGDGEAVLRLMSDDVVFLVAGREPMRGKAAFAASQAALAGMRLTAQSEIEEVRVLGEWAWCITHLRIEVTPPGKPSMVRAGNTLSILEKRDGAWAIVRDANMLTTAG